MFNKTIQTLVFNSIKRNPNNTAIEMGDIKLSYSDINKISNLVANDLLNSNKRPLRVALMFENRINYIVSILAVLKIRGIFAPIDIFYPQERINTILNEFNFDVILNDLDLCNPKYNNIKIPSDVSNLSCDYFNYYQQDDILINFEKYATDDPIYLYFTSGTTAMPKAVLGKNVSLAHFIDWEISFLKERDTIKVGQLTSPAFDPYLRDIFVPLCTGGTICIPKNRNYLINIGSLITWLIESQITLLHCTPTLFNAIVSSSSLHKRTIGSLRHILLAGEKVNIKYLSEWFELYQNKVVLVNLYGPSETTLAKIYHVISYQDILNQEIPLGKAISDTKIFILNENGEKCKDNEKGEICIITPFASHGYENNIELNKKKYIEYNNNCILYKTGDLGIKRKNGSIIFCGRLDRQVKISGIRIELGEIEDIILKYTGISNCVVVLSDNGDYLIAYYSGKQIDDLLHIKAFIKKFIFDNAVPKKFIYVAKFPVNANGKIDMNQIKYLNRE